MAAISTDPQFQMIVDDLNMRDQAQAVRDLVAQSILDVSKLNADDMLEVKNYKDAAIDINNITEGFKATTDARKSAALAMYGSDPLAAGNVLNEYATEMRSNYLQRQELEKTIAAKQQTNFFTDPLAFLEGRITVGSDIKKYNSLVRQYNNAEEAHNQTVAATTATGNMAEKMQQATSEALAKANAKKIEASAAEKISSIQLRGIQFNLSGAEALLRTRQADLSAGNHAFTVDMQLKSYELQLQNQAALAGERSYREQLVAEKVEEKEQNKLDQQQLLGAYNIGAAKYGAPQIGDYRIIQQYLKAGNPSAQAFILYGQDVAIKGGNTLGIPLANDSGKIARIMSQSGARPSDMTADSPMLMLHETYQQVKTQAAGQIKKPEDADGLVSKLATEKALLQLKGISVDTPNIYRGSSIVAISKAMPEAFAGSKFINETILPLGGGRTDLPVDPDVILGAATAELNKDPKRFNEIADGISQFFRAAVRTNNLTKDYTALNLPPQLGYFAKLKSGNIVGTSTHDMTVDAEVKRLLFMRSRAPTLLTTPILDPFGLIPQN